MAKLTPHIRERAIDFMPPGVETVMIICDFASATSGTTPSIGTARQVLTILQKHYVERMGRAIVVNIPQVSFHARPNPV